MRTASYMTTLGLTAIALLLAASGCEKESSSAKGIHAEQTSAAGKVAAQPSHSAVGAGHEHAGAKGAPGEAEGHGHGKQPGGGDDDLVLKKVMAQLGTDMAGLNDGLWKDDLTQVAKHAGAVADHPHVGSKEKQRLMKALGKDFAEFVKADRLVHGAASRLKVAAEKGDMTTTLKELGALQTGCVGCHASFRKRLAAP